MPPMTCEERALIQVMRAVVIRERRVLMVRRASGGAFAGLWELPGGKTDGEDPQQALARELDEELGLTVVAFGLYLHRHRFGAYLEHTLTAHVDGEPQLSGEHDALLWASLGAPVPQPLSPPLSAVMAMLGGRPR